MRKHIEHLEQRRLLSATTPTDTLYPAQYALNNIGQFSSLPDADIDAPEAWKITTGSPDVYVAIIDSGVEYDHPDLIANMWTNPGEIAGDGIDNDRNGYVDDIHGYDFLNDDGDPMDDYGHGTNCAGVIAASPFNEGTVGVAWRVGIIAIKVIGSDGEGSTESDMVKAFQYINYLKNVQGVNIVATNNSYGGGTAESFSLAVRDAMAGVDQPGMSPILHVCGAGNDSDDLEVTPLFPGAYNLENIITVAATDANDRYMDFSSYGATSVDLAAPGVNNFTTWLHHQTSLFGGTSASTPFVTGAAALVWSAFPNLTAAQVKQRILDNVDPIGQIGNNSSKPTLTNGRLNIAKALAGAPVENDNKAPAVVSNLSLGGTTFQSATLNWTATGDDGITGRAAFYDVRYSTTPITGNNWDSAIRVLGESGPKTSGSAETLTVAGLGPAQTYYFAMKVRDNMGNQSGLSNITQTTTAAADTVFNDNMEHGVNGWTASGLWHQSTSRANSPTTAWYYGIEASMNYDTGTANSGVLTSPLIDLRKPGTAPVLIYREWREMEDVSLFDTARVQVSAKTNTWETVYQSELSTAIDPLNWQDSAALYAGWNLTLKSKFSTPQWVSRAIDLSAYAGKKIQIRFVFDTVNDGFNNFEGWHVDDVNVFSAAALAPSAGLASPAPSGTFSSTSIANAGRSSNAWRLVDVAAFDVEFLGQV